MRSPQTIKRSAAALTCLIVLTRCATPAAHPAVADPRPGMPAFTGGTPMLLPPPEPSAQVSGTIVAGTPSPEAPAGPRATNPKSGDVTLNFPAADPRVVAQAVLGDMLHLHYQVTPGAVSPVTLVTAKPVARSALLGLLEDALRQSNLALSLTDGVYIVQPVEAAREAASEAGPATVGFATETVHLQFVSADEMKRVIDSLLPGAVAGTDPGQNTLLIAGTTGQRASVHDLVRRFDVNWLRNMSFALFVPKNTDSRLIVPELEKLINGEGAPTRGLVRLIAMDRLNGIIAITPQRQYLDDIRRWIEVLDREGQSNERRLFVYRVQNGRARDLVKVLNTAFGRGGGSGSNAETLTDRTGFDAGTAFETSSTAPADGGATPSGNPLMPPSSQPGGAATSTAAIPGPARTGVNDRDNPAVNGTISSDDTNNSIVVYGNAHDFAIVEEALRQLDIVPSQVMIEAAITEVTLNDDLRYGVQWSFSSGNSNVALSQGGTSAPTRIFPGFSYFYGGASIQATLNALEQRTKVNVISAPKLMVLNNQTAALQVGDEVPVAISSAVGVTTADAPIVNSIEYRDTGVILKITPRVNSGGLVLLDISQEVSAVSAATTTTSTTNNSPTITTRRISTSVAVQDGQVLALGGLIRSTRTKGTTGLPYLSRIPVLGGLFGHDQDTEDRTELLVLIKPHVIRSPEDANAITDELRAKIMTAPPPRSNSPLP